MVNCDILNLKNFLQLPIPLLQCNQSILPLMLFQRRMKEPRVFITLINPSHPIFLGHFFKVLHNSLERINLLPSTSSTLSHNLVFTTSSSSTFEFILAPKPSNTSTSQPQSFVFISFRFSLNKYFSIVSKSSS